MGSLFPFFIFFRSSSRLGGFFLMLDQEAVGNSNAVWVFMKNKTSEVQG